MLSVMSIGFLLRERDDAVIWRGPMKYGVIKQFLKDVEWGELDYLVVDSPPGTGDEPLAVAQLIEKADGAVVVTTPQEVAVQDVRRCIVFCRQVGASRARRGREHERLHLSQVRRAGQDLRRGRRPSHGRGDGRPVPGRHPHRARGRRVRRQRHAHGAGEASLRDGQGLRSHRPHAARAGAPRGRGAAGALDGRAADEDRGARHQRSPVLSFRPLRAVRPVRRGRGRQDHRPPAGAHAAASRAGHVPQVAPRAGRDGHHRRRDGFARAEPLRPERHPGGGGSLGRRARRCSCATFSTGAWRRAPTSATTRSAPCRRTSIECYECTQCGEFEEQSVDLGARPRALPDLWRRRSGA